VKSSILPENILKHLRPEDRPKGQLTCQEAGEKVSERQEQGLFYNWLLLAEGRGELAFDQSATNKRVTSRTGFPDFRIWPDHQPAFFIEFKVAGGKASPEQQERFAALGRLGYEVHIARSCDEAIKIVRLQRARFARATFSEAVKRNSSFPAAQCADAARSGNIETADPSSKRAK
jgi:hypothetical protein